MKMRTIQFSQQRQVILVRYKKATKKQVNKIKDLAEKNQLSIDNINKLSQTAASQLIRNLERGELDAGGKEVCQV